MNDSIDGPSLPSETKSSAIPIVVTIFAAIGIVSSLVWFFGADLIIDGLFGVLLIILIITVVGAVVIAVVLIVMGKPVISILPLLWVGAKTIAIIIGIALLLFILWAILISLTEKSEQKESDK